MRNMSTQVNSALELKGFVKVSMLIKKSIQFQYVFFTCKKSGSKNEMKLPYPWNILATKWIKVQVLKCSKCAVCDENSKLRGLGASLWRPEVTLLLSLSLSLYKGTLSLERVTLRPTEKSDSLGWKKKKTLPPHSVSGPSLLTCCYLCQFPFIKDNMMPKYIYGFKLNLSSYLKYVVA